MLLTHFLYSLLLYLITAALSITEHDSQSPLLPDRKISESQSNGVVLVFRESGSDVDHQVTIPLRTKVYPGIDLPNRLSVIEITAVTEQGLSTSPATLERIICKITPKISAEESEAADAGMKPKVWPWFAVRDGAVSFEDDRSRWFLGGRAIESYECR